MILSDIQFVEEPDFTKGSYYQSKTTGLYYFLSKSYGALVLSVSVIASDDIRNTLMPVITLGEASEHNGILEQKVFDIETYFLYLCEEYQKSYAAKEHPLDTTFDIPDKEECVELVSDISPFRYQIYPSVELDGMFCIVVSAQNPSHGFFAGVVLKNPTDVGKTCLTDSPNDNIGMYMFIESAYDAIAEHEYVFGNLLNNEY